MCSRRWERAAAERGSDIRVVSERIQSRVNVNASIRNGSSRGSMSSRSPCGVTASSTTSPAAIATSIRRRASRSRPASSRPATPGGHPVGIGRVEP